MQKRSARAAAGAFVAEGTAVIRSAVEAGVQVESLYVGAGSSGDPEPAAIAERVRLAGARVFELAPGVLERVADTVTPQPLLAVLPMGAAMLEDITGGHLVVLCAGVRDPGNAGTVLRSADAAGAHAVVCCSESVDPYNPKTVRASAGSIFHLPVVVAGDARAALAVLGAQGYRRLGAVAHGGTDYTQVDWAVPTVLVLGNEATGLRADLWEEIDGGVGVPMEGRAESLNVGVACAVICFEALRQRRARLTTPGKASTMPDMPDRTGSE